MTPGPELCEILGPMCGNIIKTYHNKFFPTVLYASIRVYGGAISSNQIMRLDSNSRRNMGSNFTKNRLGCLIIVAC